MREAGKEQRPMLGNSVILADGKVAFIVSVKTGRQILLETAEEHHDRLDAWMRSRVGADWVTTYWEAKVRTREGEESYIHPVPGEEPGTGYASPLTRPGF
jgi:hypothetical protein